MTACVLVSSLNRPQPGGIDKPLPIFLHQKRLLRYPVGLWDVGDHLWGVDFGHLRGALDADVDRVVVGGVPDVNFAELTLVTPTCFVIKNACIYVMRIYNLVLITIIWILYINK